MKNLNDILFESTLTSNKHSEFDARRAELIKRNNDFNKEMQKRKAELEAEIQRGEEELEKLSQQLEDDIKNCETEILKTAQKKFNIKSIKTIKSGKRIAAGILNKFKKPEHFGYLIYTLIHNYIRGDESKTSLPGNANEVLHKINDILPEEAKTDIDKLVDLCHQWTVQSKLSNAAMNKYTELTRQSYRTYGGGCGSSSPRSHC